MEQLPETAAGASVLAATFLAAFGGIAASVVTDAVKALPWLKDGEKSKLSGWLAGIVTGFFSLAAGIGADRLAEYATGLDTSGLWQVIVWFGPWLFAEARYRFKKATG